MVNQFQAHPQAELGERRGCCKYQPKLNRTQCQRARRSDGGGAGGRGRKERMRGQGLGGAGLCHVRASD